MKKSTAIFISILMVLILLLSACNFINNVDSITITEEKVRLKIGDTHQLEVVITPKNTGNSEVTWYSSNETVATVDVNTGKVTAIKEGNSKITAKAKNGVTSEICWIFVESLPTAVDKLTNSEYLVYDVLTYRDVLYQYFKEPSSITVRDVQDIVFLNKEGEEMRYASCYYMTLAGNNGFGGTTVDSYVVVTDKVYTIDSFIWEMESTGEKFLRFESLDDFDLDALNRALKEYFEKKGW